MRILYQVVEGINEQPTLSFFNDYHLRYNKVFKKKKF